MYVQSLKAQNNQSFGKMTICNSAKAALSQRLKNPKDIETLQKLIDNQEFNKNTSVFLYTSNEVSTRLSANMTGKFFYESVFYQFINPLKFIKEICKKADKLELEIAKEKKNI